MSLLAQNADTKGAIEALQCIEICTGMVVGCGLTTPSHLAKVEEAFVRYEDVLSRSLPEGDKDLERALSAVQMARVIFEEGLGKVPVEETLHWYQERACEQLRYARWHATVGILANKKDK